jgi:hypothetical protein
MSSEAAKKAWATRRARTKKRTPVQRLTTLANELARWRRKETIARNKLKKLNLQLEQLLEEVLIPPLVPDGTFSTMFKGRKISK